VPLFIIFVGAEERDWRVEYLKKQDTVKNEVHQKVGWKINNTVGQSARLGMG
jgi:hypothetical protein